MMPDEQAVPTADNQEQPAEQPVQAEAPKQPSLDDLPYDLDLDLLAPQPKKVKIADTIYTVTPPSVSQMIELYRLGGILEDTKLMDAEQPTQAMLDSFAKIIPDFDGSTLSLAQVWMLFSFIISMVNPTENSALKALRLEPTAEKKTTQD